MTRLLPATLLLVLLLPAAPPALALALAEAEMHSRLNQPLDARIRLLSATDEDLANMSVTVRTGTISEPGGGPALKFEVQSDDKGSFLRVTTRDPVREPVMKMMIDINWPDGRLLREYSLILDLSQP